MSLMQMSVTGSCLIIAIAVFRAVFFRRLPKRTLVWLWIGAALALLIPLRLHAAWSIYGLLPAAPVSRGTAVAVAAPTGVPLWTVIRRAVSITLALCLAAVYGVGLNRFYQGRIIREPWSERWLCDHPLRRDLTIRESDRIGAPVSGGLLRPVILLPARRDWDEETLDCVLTHEFTHIRKLDGLIKLLSAAAVCLHWFNPLAWLMAFLVSRDLEFACDEAVLSGETGRVDYARALLATESARRAKPLLANGFGGATVKRMAAVARFRRPGAVSRVASILAAAALAAVFATSPVRAAVKPAEKALFDTEIDAVNVEIVPGSYAYVVNDGTFHEIVVSDGANVYYMPVEPGDNDPDREIVISTDVISGEPVRYRLEDTSDVVSFQVERNEKCSIVP